MKLLIKNNHNPLVGRIRINGSKNAVLPIMAASLLSDSPITLLNVPDLVDVHLMFELLRSFGAEVSFIRNRRYNANHILKIDCSNINSHIKSNGAAAKIRASFLMLGPTLSKFGQIETVFPGGCNIGKRPVDMHIKALEKMGAEIKIDGNNIFAIVNGKLQGREITFKKVSVGATENIIMAAVLAEGVTTINNSAIEPEVFDLINFLKKMGADIKVNDREIVVKGVKKLHGCEYEIIPDRIEAGTYALAAIITNGKLKLEGVKIQDTECILHELGANVTSYDDGIIVSRKNGNIKSINVATDVYPKFPSDMQPQLMATVCLADGVSVIEENIFDNRFTHVDELKKLGAHIDIEENRAIVTGMEGLHGSNLCANDLRSAAALVLASLAAKQETMISDCHHLYRGYESMHEKLNSCGANIFILT